jgi:ABC-2 type transport system permease protein
VKKVRFPLSVLPLSQVGFALVHFVLQLFVLLVVMAVTGNTEFAGPNLLLAVPAIAVALLFTVAVSFLVAGLNVRYRDTQHVVEVVLMAGFWINPIVYSVSLVKTELGDLYWAYFLNPMAGVVVAMQRAIYAQNPTLPGGSTVLAADGYAFYLEKLGIGALVSAAVLALGLWLYHRLSADFAEEL